MAIALEKECNVEQGYDYKQDEHASFGYITQLALGNNVIPADIRGVTPGDNWWLSPPNVVAVVSGASWSTLPNENITLQARISVQNAQLLNMLAMQSLKNVIFRVDFVIYDHDGAAYYTSFKSYKGEPVSGTVISAKLGKPADNSFGLKVGNVAMEDPPGITNYTLELTLAPPIAAKPQQLLIQPSPTTKLIQPWGIPQV